MCKKGPAFGHSRSHSMVATKRRFNPNLQKVRIDVGGAPRREYVCTRCLKKGVVRKAIQQAPFKLPVSVQKAQQAKAAAKAPAKAAKA